MTLLLVEMKRVDQEFDACWVAWQKQQGFASIFTVQDGGAIHDHFPLILYEYFPHISLRAARLVARASRACGMHTFLWQHAADGRLSLNEVQAASAWLRAYAEDQLQQVISDHAWLWQQFAAAYDRWQSAWEAEQSCLSLPVKPYPAAHFSQVVRGKTALAGLTVLAFAHLSSQQERVAALYESQCCFYAGTQIYRDVLNWKQDFVAGRLSYVLVNLLLETSSEVVADSQVERQAQVQAIGRRFYYTGFAERMLQAAAECFCRALAAVTDLPPTSWGAVLAGRLEQTEEVRKDISQIRRQQVAKAHSYQYQSPRRAELITPPISAAEIDKAIDAAANYLAHEQAADGHWGDFLLLGEQSTFWVTGYVAWILQRTRSKAADLSLAARWLVDNQFVGGGWGYNSHWPKDIDSTANVLLFLSDCPQVHPTQWAPALEFLLANQRSDGGFTTITDAEAWLSRFRSNQRDLSGWTASHPCVTSVVTLLLATLNHDRYRTRVAQAMQYLRACQRCEGYWDAYWWVGRLYTTSRVVQATHVLDDPLNTAHVVRASRWLLSSQCADSGWADDVSAKGQPFHTALAVQALSVLDQQDAVAAALVKGIRWLLTHQLPDGSWPAVPILRVPTPDTLCPWEQTAWRESILGLGVVVPDWRRLFTTATVLHALHAVTDNSAFVLANPDALGVHATERCSSGSR